MSNNSIVKDKDARILLDRRAEIRATINKLEAEYQAIGNILTKVYNYEHKDDRDIEER